MTPKFLREEAARFREMAESTEREASKARLLAMAADYDARAAAAGDIVEPERAEPNASEPGLDETAPSEPAESEPIKAKPTRRISVRGTTLTARG